VKATQLEAITSRLSNLAMATSKQALRPHYYKQIQLLNEWEIAAAIVG